MAALFHDIGKGPTKKYLPKIGWTFHNHEFIGAKMIFEIFKRLKMPLNDKMKYVQKIVLMSSRPIIISERSYYRFAIRRLVFDAGPISKILLRYVKQILQRKTQFVLKNIMIILKLFEKKLSL